MMNQVTGTSGVPPGEEARRARFGPFEMDLATLDLSRAGRRVRLQAQPARLLALLLRHPGQVVSREEMRRALWGDDTFVDFEQGINQAIRLLRAALRDDAETPRYLETLPRIGYRFIAPVTLPSLPQEPPPSAAAPVRALRRPSLRAAVLSLISAAAIVTLLVSWERSPSSHARPVLAVLPFEELGGGSPTGLGDTLTEELIGRMGTLYGGRMGVIARTSARAYRGSGKDIRQIGRELGASHVLEGSVNQAGPRVRVLARLVRARDQIPLWSTTYELPPHELPDMQSDVAARIARALALNLLPDADRAQPAARTHPRAYELYVQGKGRLAARSPDEAAGLFERCLEIDPGFAPAWVALGQARRARGGADREREKGAREAFEKALALDDGLVEAHVQMGLLRFYRDLDTAGARREFDHALRINPASAEAWHGKAATHAAEGRHDLALDAVQRALSHDPVHPMVASDAGWYFYWARRYDDAIAQSRRTLAIQPGFFWANRCILLACLMKGDRAAAARQATDEMRQAPGHTPPVPAGGTADPEQVLEAYWRGEMERTRAEVAARRRSPADLAMIHLVQGDLEAALQAFERAYEARAGWILPFLTVEPLADPLRDDPRFEALLSRLRSPG